MARPAGGAARPRCAVPRPGGVRLTRRGRIVVTALLAGLVLLTAVLATAARAQASSSGVPAATVLRSMTKVTVLPGQTLWSIAVQAEPSGDPRAEVQRIMEVNGLRATSLHPGQQLWVPAG